MKRIGDQPAHFVYLEGKRSLCLSGQTLRLNPETGIRSKTTDPFYHISLCKRKVERHKIETQFNLGSLTKRKERKEEDEREKDKREKRKNKREKRRIKNKKRCRKRKRRE